MLRPSLLAAITIFAAVSPPASAWNALGHKVVAEIAWRKLDPDKRQQIVDILRRHPRFDADFAAKMDDDAAKGDKEVQDHWIFQHAATWPDIARGIKGDEHKQYDRPTWHYIDFPLYLNPSDRKAFAGNVPVNLSTKYPTRTPIEDFNVLEAIGYCRATLHDRGSGADTKALAYCWLFHLVGDIHQPLHSTALFSVEHFPKGDRGGNEIKLKRGENLHALWDGLLGSSYYMRNVKKAMADLSGERFSDVWDTAAKDTNPIKWANESHRLCESFVYDCVILDAVRESPAGTETPKIELPQEYYKEAGEHARRRIIAAGSRLAALLRP